MTTAAAGAAARPAEPDPLVEAWSNRPGVVGWLAAVNHKTIGLRFVVTAFVFLVAGGIEALLLRSQLARPEAGVVSAQAYNELFTMHGTTMMFLFAVPVLEGLGMYFLPLMLGTRDLPFPRLNAFGYWTFLLGGLILYSSFLAGEVPDGGWFAYPPLTDGTFSPGRGMDFWLLGVTLTEISAIVGATELVVAFLKRRAPGMTLGRVPVFVWAAVVMAGMILLAFPSLVVGSLLLESDRLLGTRFYDPSAGGDPLLWQHLFWFFGHPEVYIMLIPATGIVSMVVPALARRALAGYSWVVAALVATGIVSFGLWVHHMFAVGLPILALGLFSAASFVIVLPSAVQLFAWLATLWSGRPALRTPLMFVLGFLVVFVAGGITGIMVAAAPFDWQAHDSFFVVAHFHYVLIGGMVFPLFGGLYYWFPKWTGRLLSEPLGQASFWTMLVGFNVAFFPQHLLGLDGMPRRTATYAAVEGWETGNLVSTVGSFVLAAGIALTAANVLWALRRGERAGRNPWGAGSLEWLADSPPAPYAFRLLPVVGSRDPLREEGAEALVPADGKLARVVRELAEPAAPVREVLETTAVAAEPERVVRLPGPSLLPLATAAALGLALVGALLYSVPLAVAGAALALVGAVASALTLGEPEDAGPRSLPVGAAGAGWWGLVVGLWSVAMALAGLAFGYVLLLTGEDEWPTGGAGAPGLALPLAATALVAVAGAATWWASRAAREGRGPRLGGLLLGLAATVVFAVTLGTSLGTMDADPQLDAYGSIATALVGFHLLLAAALALALGVVAWQLWRRLAPGGGVVPVRVATALALFVAGSWAVTLLTVYVAPRVA